jgi:catechol 2,3-dioxygenase-like lactoylglutathione lyase family enzyme
MPEVALSLLVIRSPDLDRCRRFYEALGLTFTEDQHGSGPRHLAAVLAGGTVLEIYPSSDTGLVGRGTVADIRLGFIVDDLPTALAAVRAPPQPSDVQAVVTDPDGRRVELTQRR